MHASMYVRMHVCLLIQVTAPLYRAMETDTASTLEERYKDLAEEVIEVRRTRTRANKRTHKHTLSLSLSPTHAQHTHAHKLTHTRTNARAHTQVLQGVVGHEAFFGAYNSCRLRQKNRQTQRRSEKALKKLLDPQGAAAARIGKNQRKVRGA